MTFGDVWEFLSEHKEHKVLRSSITLGDILNDMLKCHQEVIDAKLTIAALTARAEQAEWERDAAVAVIRIQAAKRKESHVVLCNICEFEDMIGCVHKNHCDGYQLFKYRGLPQEGEGV